MQLFVEAHCHIQNVSSGTAFILYKLNAQLQQIPVFATVGTFAILILP